MNAAGRMFLFRGSEALEAGCMVNMTAPERGDQNGSIEELLHPRTLFDNCAAAVFAFAVEEIGDGGVRRLSLIDPDAEFLLEHNVLADGTQSDALAFRFQMQGVAGSELQTVAKGLGQNDAAGFIEGKLVGHDGSMEWEKPIVNGIWQKNEAGLPNQGHDISCPYKKMPGFPTQTVGTPTNRGKARHYERVERECQSAGGCKKGMA